MNFLNALEKIPGLIAQEKERMVLLEKDQVVLQEMVNSTWNKEPQLGSLKTELAAIDRKILLSITPEKEQEREKSAEVPVEIENENTSIKNSSGMKL